MAKSFAGETSLRLHVATLVLELMRPLQVVQLSVPAIPSRGVAKAARPAPAAPVALIFLAEQLSSLGPWSLPRCSQSRSPAEVAALDSLQGLKSMQCVAALSLLVG